MKPVTEALSSFRALANGSLWNAIGRVFSIVIGFLATPLLLRILGTERWGLFALALAICGTFGILDFGVSAALTRALAARIGTRREQEAPILVRVSIITLTAVGSIVASVCYCLVPIVVRSLFGVPPDMQHEAIIAFRILALGSPLIVVNAAMWGVLAAYQKFLLANTVNLPINICYFLAPILALMFRADLPTAVAALLGVRVVQTGLYLVLIPKVIPKLYARPVWDTSHLRELLTIGAWITVSNTLTPVVMQADRFVVATALPLVAISYYSAPLDLVLRFLFIPIAISTAFYPAVAVSYGTMPERPAALLRLGSLITILAIWPACSLVVGFPDELMTAWLGADFSAESHTVLAILGIGVFAASLSILPANLTDAVGRPDVGAKLMIAQFILFPGLIIVLARNLGVEGVAIAWTLRCIITLGARLWVAAKVCPSVRSTVSRVGRVTAVGTSMLILYLVLHPVHLRWVVLALTAPMLLVMTVYLLTERSELSRWRQFLPEVYKLKLLPRFRGRRTVWIRGGHDA